MNTSVQEAATQFYKALNALFTGEVEPMKQVWSHAEDITFMGPAGEFHVGWNTIQKDWEMVAGLKLGGKVEAVGIRVFEGQDIAITQNYEKGENKDQDGNPISVSMRATNIFRKEGGEWKMISHQTDLMPYLANK